MTERARRRAVARKAAQGETTVTIKGNDAGSATSRLLVEAQRLIRLWRALPPGRAADHVEQARALVMRAVGELRAADRLNER
jgi:hypothetical protein